MKIDWKNTGFTTRLCVSLNEPWILEVCASYSRDMIPHCVLNFAFFPESVDGEYQWQVTVQSWMRRCLLLCFRPTLYIAIFSLNERYFQEKYLVCGPLAEHQWSAKHRKSGICWWSLANSRFIILCFVYTDSGHASVEEDFERCGSWSPKTKRFDGLAFFAVSVDRI